MDQIPDSIIINIFGYLPSKSFLPISHISKRFRLLWIEYKETTLRLSNDQNCNSCIYETNPFEIGNLFESSWYQRKNWNYQYDHNCLNGKKSSKRNMLNTSLLTYYIENGFGYYDNQHSCSSKEDTFSSNTYSAKQQKERYEKGRRLLRKVMLQTASRGDIDGMRYMSQRKYFALDDEEICTMTAAAGHLDALKWLRGESINYGERNDVRCPWDPTEVHREAAENSHDDIIAYVEKNCGRHDIQMHYGVGLPW